MKQGKTHAAKANLKRLAASVARLEAVCRDQGLAVPEVLEHIEEKKHELLGFVTQRTDVGEEIRIARHPQRPTLKDYLEVMVQDFLELHGDKCFGDDPAIMTGFGRIGPCRVLLVGHNKGRTLSQKHRCRYGCALPEGYRKALAKMKIAEKFGLPVVCLIDTPGAYPGMEAEERGQALAIAQNLREMSRLRVPLVGIVLGEGGSGGALGIGVCDRMAMLEHAYYSVASPEACAAILWRDRRRAVTAARALKIMSRDVLSLGWCDEIIPEPPGGAHLDPRQAIYNVQRYLLRSIGQLAGLSRAILLDRRYERLRAYGRSFLQSCPADAG